MFCLVAVEGQLDPFALRHDGGPELRITRPGVGNARDHVGAFVRHADTGMGFLQSGVPVEGGDPVRRCDHQDIRRHGADEIPHLAHAVDQPLDEIRCLILKTHARRVRRQNARNDTALPCRAHAAPPG